MAVQPPTKIAEPTSGDGSKSKAGQSSEGDSNESNLVIVDMGKQDRKRIKRLRKGRGKLMGKIENIVSDLAEDEIVPEDAAVVVVIVKEKPTVGNFFDLSD